MEPGKTKEIEANMLLFQLQNTGSHVSQSSRLQLLLYIFYVLLLLPYLFYFYNIHLNPIMLYIIYIIPQQNPDVVVYPK